MNNSDICNLLRKTMEENLKKYILKEWYEDVIPELKEYIKIPNLSPYFDKNCLTNGLQEKAVELITNWISKQDIKGMNFKVVTDEGKTPVILVEVQPYQSDNDETILMYGHLDKQPPFDGWDEGLGPYTPVIKDGKLYGRGGADDGYSTYCALLSIKALQKFNISHSRIVVLIEASEESGSVDLEHYVEKLKFEIGSPNLVICLDSGCGNYEQLWVTSSLRGCIGGTLSCKTLKEGVHSGDSSGIIPGTFRILRQLISRIEDPNTGDMLLDELKADITEDQLKQVKIAAQTLGKEWMCDHFPFLRGVIPVTDDVVEMALNRWWQPQLVITGQEGLPACNVAGNVMRPETKLTLSVRLPPTVDPKVAAKLLKYELEKDPPHGSKINFSITKASAGFCAPKMSDWLEQAVKKASMTVFEKPCVWQGDGMSIPFMSLLRRNFPKADFCVIGLLGPHSNAHGPNESLDIKFSGQLACCLSLIVRGHARNPPAVRLQTN